MDLMNLFAHACAVLVLLGAILGSSHLLGERGDVGGSRNDPYESGQIPGRSASGAHPVGFYVVALMFLLFDVEVLYLLAWAPVVSEAGWLGLIEVSVFACVLLVVVAYLWRTGVFEWGTRRARTSLRASNEAEGPAT